MEIMPGSKVLVFDSLLFEDDKSTPLNYTFRAATVISRYGFISKFVNDLNDEPAKYPDCVDVEFDHRSGKISKGHFTYGVYLLYWVENEQSSN